MYLLYREHSRPVLAAVLLPRETSLLENKPIWRKAGPRDGGKQRHKTSFEPINSAVP